MALLGDALLVWFACSVDRIGLSATVSVFLDTRSQGCGATDGKSAAYVASRTAVNVRRRTGRELSEGRVAPARQRIPPSCRGTMMPARGIQPLYDMQKADGVGAIRPLNGGADDPQLRNAAGEETATLRREARPCHCSK